MNGKARSGLAEREHSAKKFKFAGTSLLRQGKFREAVDQYRLATIFNPRFKSDIILDYERLIYLDSKNLEARFSLANFYLAVGDKSSAIEELEEILEINPHIIEVYNLLGKMYLEESRIEDCIHLLEKALKLGIKDLVLTETLAGAYLEKNRFAQATVLYEEILNFEGRNKKILRILGDLYGRQKRFEEAALTYLLMLSGDTDLIEEVCVRLEEIRAQAAQNLVVLESLAEAYVKNIKPGHAVELYQQILKLKPDYLDRILAHYRKILGLYPSHPETLLALAQGLTQKGEYSEAAQMYSKVVKLSPELADKAIYGYKEIIAIYPAQVFAHQLLAVAYLAKNDREAAICEFKELLKLNPQDLSFVEKKALQLFKENYSSPSLHLVLGTVYFLKEDYSRAQTEVNQVLTLNPKNIEGHLLLSQIYQKMGAYDQALSTLRNALGIELYNLSVHQAYAAAAKEHLLVQIRSVTDQIKLGGDGAEEHFNLGKYYLETGSLDSAIEELQRANQKQVNFARPSFELLGKCFILQNRYDLAASQFEKIISQSPAGTPKTSNLKYKLGLCCQALGNLREATQNFEEIYSEDVNFPTLKERLGYLKKISPSRLKNKNLICLATPELEDKKVAAWFGIDPRSLRAKGSDVLSYSFGQAHDSSGLENFFKGNYYAAEEEFRLATELDQSLVSALNNLGVIYLLKEEFSLAEEYLKRAAELDSESAVCLNNLGVAYYFQGKFKEAENLFIQAVQLNRRQAESDVNLAQVLYENGSIKEALMLWEKYAEFDLTSEFVQRTLRYKRVKVDV